MSLEEYEYGDFYYAVRCNGCRHECESAYTSREAYAIAQRAGFVRSGDRDYCAECAPRIAIETAEKAERIVDEIRAIMHDLAALEPIESDLGASWCVLCGVRTCLSVERSDSDHLETCPWRRAREFDRKAL